ncbi:hypothetical protein [Chitinophaga sp. RAB17]
MEKVLLPVAGGLFVAVCAQFVPGQPRTTGVTTAIRGTLVTGFSFDIHII